MSGNIQVYCEQKALFVNPFNNKEEFVVDEFSFSSAPSWITTTYMWELLVKDGKIKLINSVKDAEEKIEKKELSKEEVEKVVDDFKEDVEVEDEVETMSDNEIEMLSNMTKKGLYALCKEKGIDVESKQPKEYYLKMLANNK